MPFAELRSASFAAGASCAVLSLPSASADPVEPEHPGRAPPAAAVADDCTAAGLAKTISSVTAAEQTYFAAHPDSQPGADRLHHGSPAFSAMGAFDDYFKAHPEEADELRGIQAPLGAFKDRCGMQVAPTDALAVLAEV